MKLPLLPTSKVTLGEPVDPADHVDTPRATRREHFSFSQLTMYLRCSLQYWYRYIEGRKERPNIALVTGSGVHEALEWNSRKKLATGYDLPVPDLRDLTSDLLDVHHQEVDDSDKVKGTMKDKAIGAVTLHRTRSAPAITPIAIEYPFTLTIDPDDTHPDPVLPVIGFVDQYAEIPRPSDRPGRSSRVIAVEDYKWVNQKRSQLEVDLTPQLTLYDHVFEQTTGQVPDVIGYRMFGFNSDGPYAAPIYRSKEFMTPEVRATRIARLLQQIRRVQDAISKGVFIPTDDAKVCSWCGYRDDCQYSLIKAEPPR